MKPEPQRPDEHQRLITTMQDAKAPPADGDTPDMPTEVLRRLQGQYGTAQPEPEPTPERRCAIVEDSQPTFWASLIEIFTQPKFAFAALLVLAGTTALIVQSPPPEPDTDLMRGHTPPPRGSVPAYWLTTDKSQPAPTGLGLPKFIIITAADQLPQQGEALIFDPQRKEVRALNNGQTQSTQAITDPTDNDEWLTAHRQLTRPVQP